LGLHRLLNDWSGFESQCAPIYGAYGVTGA